MREQYASFSSIENFDKFIIFSNNLNLKVVDIEILRKLSTFEGLNHIEEL